VSLAEVLRSEVLGAAKKASSPVEIRTIATVRRIVGMKTGLGKILELGAASFLVVEELGDGVARAGDFLDLVIVGRPAVRVGRIGAF